MTPPHWIHRHAPPKGMGFELGGGEFENRVNFCCVWAADLSEPYRIIVCSVANYKPHLSHFW